MTVLVADVGGTNTRVGLAQDGRLLPRSVLRYRNADYAAMSDVLSAYLRDHGPGALSAACVAIAGPVRHGIGRLTNRDWMLSEDELQRISGSGRGLVINDLVAQGYALDLCEIRPVFADGEAVCDPSETRLVVGIGTGFNAAPVYGGPAGPLVVPSECGHITLPVWDGPSARVADGLRAHHGFASVEDALAGRSLSVIYQLVTGHPAPEDPGEIFACADTSPDGPEVATLRYLMGALGRVIGDLALVHLPFGGVVLIGGVARAYRPHMGPLGLRPAMADKGRFGDFMSHFNIFVMDDDVAALEGCANYAYLAAGAGSR